MRYDIQQMDHLIGMLNQSLGYQHLCVCLCFIMHNAPAVDIRRLLILVTCLQVIQHVLHALKLCRHCLQQHEHLHSGLFSAASVIHHLRSTMCFMRDSRQMVHKLWCHLHHRDHWRCLDSILSMELTVDKWRSGKKVQCDAVPVLCKCNAAV